MKRAMFALGGFALLFGCAPALKEDPNDVEQIFDTAVATQQKDDGSFETTIIAIDSEVWIEFSFDTGKEVFVVDPMQDQGWDLRFSRFNFRVNGGVSGPGDVEVAPLPKSEYENIVQAPESGYFTDEPDVDMDGDEDLVFRRPHEGYLSGWFAYDPRFHTLTPAPINYVVKAQNQVFYKLEFLGYYDEHGEAGFPRFRWARIGSPSP